MTGRWLSTIGLGLVIPADGRVESMSNDPMDRVPEPTQNDLEQAARDVAQRR